MNTFNNKKALLASILGALSTIPAEIVTWLLALLGLAKHDDYQLYSLVAMIDKPDIVLGTIISFIIGGLLGLLLYLLVEKTGKELMITKSLFLGFILWFVFESSFTVFFEGLLKVNRSHGGHYVHLIGTVTYGIVQGVLFKTVLYRRISGDRD